MSRLGWARFCPRVAKLTIVSCLVLTGSAAVAENSKPRNILEFLFGTRRAEQPTAITPAAPQSIAPPMQNARPRADKDKKATRKSASRQSIDSDEDDRKPNRSLRRGKLNPIDPEKRVAASGSYSGPFRGAGNQAFCVRTCDGYFFPVNHEGARGDDRYDSVCQQSCPGAQTQVYFMRRGGDIRYSSTARGTPYASLENALKYRKERDPACTCKSQEQQWSSILTEVEPKIRHNKADLVITPEISQRIAQGEDAAAILKANVQQAKTDGEEPARRADASASTAPAIRASFGNRIAPADRFIKIDPEPTGSISPKAKLSPRSAGAPSPDAPKAVTPRAEQKQPKPEATLRAKTPARASAEAAPVKTAMARTDLARTDLARTDLARSETAKSVMPKASAEKGTVQKASPAKAPAAKAMPEKTTVDKGDAARIDRLALRQALDRLGTPNQR